MREGRGIKINQVFLWVIIFTLSLFVHIPVVGNNNLPLLASSEFPAIEAKRSR